MHGPRDAPITKGAIIEVMGLFPTMASVTQCFESVSWNGDRVCKKHTSSLMPEDPKSTPQSQSDAPLGSGDKSYFWIRTRAALA